MHNLVILSDVYTNVHDIVHMVVTCFVLKDHR